MVKEYWGMVGDTGRRLLVCRNDLWFQPDLVDLGENIFIANVIPQMLIKLFNPLQFCKPEACTDLPAKVTWGDQGSPPGGSWE